MEFVRLSTGCVRFAIRNCCQKMQRTTRYMFAWQNHTHTHMHNTRPTHTHTKRKHVCSIENYANKKSSATMQNKNKIFGFIFASFLSFVFLHSFTFFGKAKKNWKKIGKKMATATHSGRHCGINFAAYLRWIFNIAPNGAHTERKLEQRVEKRGGCGPGRQELEAPRGGWGSRSQGKQTRAKNSYAYVKIKFLIVFRGIEKA